MQTISEAVDRLEDQLPLRQRQAALAPVLAEVHRTILLTFASTGRPPTDERIEEIAGTDAVSVLERLAADDLIVAADGRIEGAYPFSVTPTPHGLSIGDVQIHAMCALDAVAVAPVFGLDVVTTSRCAVSDAPIRIHQTGETVQSFEPSTVHVGVRWQRPDGCAAHSMCREMVFLSDRETAERWRGDDPDGAGIFDLTQAIEFGVGFFGPLVASSGR